MPDQPSPTESEDHIERRIDEVISQAAELARELKEEVGDPEPAGKDRDQKFFESEASSEPAPEMQLAQADAAIAHAAREIGSQAPPPKTTKVTLPPRNPKPGATPPAAGAASPAQPTEQAPAPAAASVDEGPRAETPSSSDASTDAGEAEPGTSTAPAASPDAETSRLASPFLERVARLFEAIDRPFTGISGNVRWALGWVALVFLVGAASLFFFVIL